MEIHLQRHNGHFVWIDFFTKNRRIVISRSHPQCIFCDNTKMWRFMGLHIEIFSWTKLWIDESYQPRVGLIFHYGRLNVLCGVWKSLMIRGFLYRLVMRIAHRYNWHYAPPIYPEGDTQLWCQWCGFRQTIQHGKLPISNAVYGRAVLRRN